MEDLYQLYKELEQLVLKEEKLIENNEYQELKKTLNLKNFLIKKIDEINQEKYFLKILNKNDDQAEVNEIKSELHDLIKNLTKIEEKKLSSLKNKKKSIKNKILELYSRKKALKATEKKRNLKRNFLMKNLKIDDSSNKYSFGGEINCRIMDI